MSKLEEQLGTLDKPFDPALRVPSKKTFARLSIGAVSK